MTVAEASLATVILPAAPMKKRKREAGTPMTAARIAAQGGWVFLCMTAGTVAQVIRNVAG